MLAGAGEAKAEHRAARHGVGPGAWSSQPFSPAGVCGRVHGSSGEPHREREHPHPGRRPRLLGPASRASPGRPVDARLGPVGLPGSAESAVATFEDWLPPSRWRGSELVGLGPAAGGMTLPR